MTAIVANRINVLYRCFFEIKYDTFKHRRYFISINSDKYTLAFVEISFSLCSIRKPVKVLISWPRVSRIKNMEFFCDSILMVVYDQTYFVKTCPTLYKSLKIQEYLK